ncbi:MAG TPA: hypothetical protein ENN25_02880 [Euryarchaeota archaeon]|nr:hypothetical protein [Euryarchaeota archaeon]
MVCDSRGNLLVVWQDLYSGQWEIKYDRLNLFGTILDYDETISSEILGNSTGPLALIGTHNETIVLWIGDIGNPEIYFTRTLLPDLSVSSGDVSLSTSSALENTTLLVDAIIRNLGDSEAQNVDVKAVVNGESRATDTIDSLAAGGIYAATFEFTVIKGDSVCDIIVDQADLIYEYDESNNAANIAFSTLYFDYTAMASASLLSIPPGGTMNLTLDVDNAGNYQNSVMINISTDDLPSDWTFQVSGGNVTNFTLEVPAGVQSSVPISISVPDGAPAGTWNIPISSVSLSDPRIGSDCAITVEVPWVGRIGLIVPNPVQLIPGNSHTFQFTVYNLGNHIEYFTADVAESNNWEVSIIGGMDFSLSPLETYVIQCNVNVPEFTLPNTMSVVVMNISSLNLTGNFISGGLTSTVTVHEEISMYVTYQNVTQDQFQLTSGAFQLEITNTGNIGEQINVTLIGNQTSFLIIDDSLFVLSPASSRTVTVNLTASADIPAGSYTFAVRAQSTSNSQIFAETSLQFSIEPFYDLYLVVDPSQVEGRSGSVLESTVSVYNFGNADDRCTLFIDYAGFNESTVTIDGFVYKIETDILPDIELDVGGHVQFSISIITEGRPPDRYAVFIMVDSANDPSVSSDASLFVVITQKRSLIDVILSPIVLIAIISAAAFGIYFLLIMLGVMPVPKIIRKEPAARTSKARASERTSREAQARRAQQPGRAATRPVQRR